MYQEFRPDQRLVPLVECGWVRSGSVTRSLRVMPDGCMDVFVSAQGDVMIAGPATTFYDLRPEKDWALTGLRLRPGTAAAVVGRPVSEFTDRQVPVDSIFGVRGREMAEKVLAATTPGRRVAALQNALIGYLAACAPRVDPAVTEAIGILQRHPGRPVCSLTDGVDLSERQLRRRFEAAVGYGPKRFSRIIRFQRLLDLIRVRGALVRWADVAIEANYSDQPHMINECLALAGMSPIALPRGAGGPTGEMSVSSNTVSGSIP